MSVHSRSNWNCEVLVFLGRTLDESNPGDIGGRQGFSPLCHPCFLYFVKPLPDVITRTKKGIHLAILEGEVGETVIVYFPQQPSKFEFCPSPGLFLRCSISSIRDRDRYLFSPLLVK